MQMIEPALCQLLSTTHVPEASFVLYLQYIKCMLIRDGSVAGGYNGSIPCALYKAVCFIKSSSSHQGELTVGMCRSI